MARDIATTPRQIVLISQWFPPEQAPIGHMIREIGMGLANQRWNVTIVTGFPNHPAGEVFGGYRKQWVLEERLAGMRVLRVWLGTSPNRSFLHRIWTFLSFTLTSSWTVLRRTNPDVIYGVFQPLSMGLILPILARLKRARLVLNVQDLHPDVPIELGLVKNSFLIRVLRGIEKFGYRRADALAVISEGFREHCITKGADPSGVHVIENWIDLDEVHPQSRDTQFRSEQGFDTDDFVVLYAGTIGWVSGAEVVIEAAKRLQAETKVKFLFVGGGPVVSRLKEKTEALGLMNVKFVPFQERSRLPEVQATSDVSIVTLAPGKGRTSIPSKVLGYMAAARPVVASVDPDCETARTLRVANCGIVVKSGSAEELAAAIVRLRDDALQRMQLGANGRQFAESHLTRDTIVNQYEGVFRAMVEQHV